MQKFRLMSCALLRAVGTVTATAARPARQSTRLRLIHWLARSPVDFHNSPRVHDLIRAGNLYLSQADALALAIENNLDVELDRFSFQIADTDLLRAKGGGLLRGIPFLLAEAPTGVGGPLSPVVTNPASAHQRHYRHHGLYQRAGTGRARRAADNLSMQGTIPQSTGTAVPIFDPAIVGQLNWMHQTTPELDILSYGVPTLVTNGFIANAGLVQAFATGAQVNLAFDNSHQIAERPGHQLQPVHRLQPGTDRHAASAARIRPRAQPPLHPHRRQRPQDHHPALSPAAHRHGLWRDPPLYRFRGALRRREGEAGDRRRGREAILGHQGAGG